MGRVQALLRGLLGAAFALSLSGSALAANGERNVSVKITDVRPAGNDGVDDNDQFVRIWIDGKGGQERDLVHCSEGTFGGLAACGINEHPQFGNARTEPVENDVTQTEAVLACKSIIPVRIQQVERDSGFLGDDSEVVLDTTFDVDLLHPQSTCAFNSGGVCFSITVSDPGPDGPDSDGDGLLDTWETTGFDANCDGVIERGPDVLLNEMGADPAHKDLFIQMDWFTGSEPLTASIQALRQAFALAPVDAGGVSNPDGKLGITLHIDAGTFKDAAGNLVGDDFSVNAAGGRDLGNPAGNPGGGPTFTAPAGEADFLALTADLQISPRRGIFRWILSGPTWANDIGGITPGFGDIMYIGRLDQGALMHELGHSLGLFHGGFEESNCKPNHISIMNYAYDAGGGIPWSDPAVAGGAVQFFIDYAPSRIPDMTLAMNRRIPLIGDSTGANGRPSLNELNLQEDDPILVATPQLTPRHQIVFGDLMGQPVRAPMGVFVDWDQNTIQLLDMNGLANVDLGAADDRDLDTIATIPACVANTPFSNLESYDEWSNIHLRPGTVPGGAIQMLPLHTEPLPTPAQITAAREGLNRADLSLAVAAHPEPANVGSPYYLDVTVSNKGPNPADRAELRITLPPGVTYVSDDWGCVPGAGGVLTCALGTLNRGEVVDLTITTSISAGNTSAQQQVHLQALHGGQDLQPSDNVATVTVQTIPAFAGFEDPTRPWVRSWTNPPVALPASTPGSQGTRSLALSCGYSQVDSPTFDTTEWGVVGNTLVVDLFIPTQQSNAWWVGEISASFDLPAAGIYNAYLGQQSLTSLPRGVWTSVSFAVPQNIKTALLGDYPDARFRLAANVGSCLAPLRIDNVRFEGGIVGRQIFHVAGSANLNVQSTGVFTFDDASRWHSNQIALANDSAVRSQGAASLAFSPASWVEIKSDPLGMAELANVTSRFNVDVFVPELPPDPNWVGDVQLYVECPSQGLYNQYAGQVHLAHSFDGEFNSAKFQLPEYIRGKLAGRPADCTMKLALNVNPAWGRFRFDRGGFVQP